MLFLFIIVLSFQFVFYANEMQTRKLLGLESYAYACTVQVYCVFWSSVIHFQTLSVLIKSDCRISRLRTKEDIF